MNTMLASVTERTREIGLRRAVGATRERIARQFLAEAAVLARRAARIAGLAIGVLGVLMVSAIAGWPVAIGVHDARRSRGGRDVGGLFFGIHPRAARGAARSDRGTSP
jgi:putative ABC transport system permease protein